MKEGNQSPSSSAECPGGAGQNSPQQVVSLAQHQLVVEAEEEGPDLPVQGGAAVTDPPGAPGAGLVQDHGVEEGPLDPPDGRAVGEELEPEVSAGSGLVGGDGDVAEGVSEEAGDEVILGQTELLVREERVSSLHQLGSHLDR